ncbi:MAG TPA: hypothetical protein VMG09_07510 [Bacteroidota bacterium]|nr:hypothetical protein [Bacteroidota bacterium]
MHVNSVSPNSSVSQASGGAQREAPVKQQPAVKKDTLVLSEKAKDMAALKAGKSAQEEMTESITAKMKEGDTQ